MNKITPEQALQLISDALEPKNISAISRQGFVLIQQALEVLAEAVKKQTDEPHDS